jgi:hypothetical protein
VNAVGIGKNKKGKGKANNRHANAVDKPPTAHRSGAPGTRPSSSWCKKLGHTYEQCWTRDPTLRPPHLQVKSVDNTNRHGKRQGGPRTNNGNSQNQPRGNVNACSYTSCTNNNCNENEVAGISGHQGILQTEDVGSSEFNVAAFLTTFDTRSFGRRIVAKIKSYLNEPTISAD